MQLIRMFYIASYRKRLASNLGAYYHGIPNLRMELCSPFNGTRMYTDLIKGQVKWPALKAVEIIMQLPSSKNMPTLVNTSTPLF